LSKNIPSQKTVVLVITRLDRGGSAELTMQLAAGLRRHGYQVTLISGKTIEPSWNPYQYAQNNNFSIVFIDSLVRPLHPVRDLTAFFRLHKIFRQIRPDILHTNSSKAGLLGRLAGRLCKIRQIYHSPHGHIFYGYYKRFISKIFIILEKYVAHYTDKILNLTEHGRQDHINEKIGRPEKFRVSSCGVDLAPYLDFPSRNLRPRQDSKISVIWIGRIVPIKNLQLLLDALVELKKEKYQIDTKIVGDGPLRAEAEQFVQKENLQNITFLGYRQDIPELLSQSDILILTSQNEGFGRVLVEAMASGLAIIATRVGGVPDIIKNGINGFLIEPSNQNQLAVSILVLIKNSKMRQKMGTVNRKNAEFYSLNNYINRVMEIYRGC
jgi:glycosyltransferase involved in cell wall biosynthesis